MKKHLSLFIRLLPIGIVSIFILMNTLVFKIHIDKLDISKDTTSVVLPDSQYNNKDEIVLHTSTILSILNQRVANTTSEMAVQDDITMQFRLFYVAIVVGLFTFLFKDRMKDKNKSDDKKDSDSPLFKWALLAVVLLMYILEIHRFDLLLRSQQAQILHTDTIEFIVNKKVDDLIWYDLNNSSLLDKMNEVNCTRWGRKIAAFFRPEIDQLIIYFVPLIILLVLWNISPRSRITKS